MKKLFCLLFLTFVFATFGLQAQIVSAQQEALKAQEAKKAKKQTEIPSEISKEDLNGKPVAKYATPSPQITSAKIKMQAEVKASKLPTVSLVKFAVPSLGQVVKEIPIQATGPKAGPEIKLGGLSVFLDGSNLPTSAAYSFFNYTFGNKSTAAVLPSPYFGLGSGAGWGLTSDYSAGVRAGAWNGNELITQVVIHDNKGNAVALGPYVKYEPLSSSMVTIASGSLSIFPQSMSFNAVTKQVLALDGGRILYSNSGKDTVFNQIDTLNLGGVNFVGLVKGMATNSFGNTFIIANDATKCKLFRVNTTTAALTLVGELGLALNVYMESATFDMLTNTLYYEYSGNSEMICTIDTLTGKATQVDNIGSETVALFHHYYTNPPPSTPTNFVVTKEEVANYKNLTLSWKNPTTNFNGEPLTGGLTKVYIYRGTTIASMVKIDSVNTTVIGETKTYKISEKADGKIFYGVQVLSPTGRSAILASWEVLIYPNKPLPYETSFENSLEAGILARGAGSKRVDSLPYTGKSAWSLSGANTSYLEINPISMKKGAQYKISFMARISGSSAPGSSNFAYFIDGSGFLKTITDTVYRKYEIIHTATETKESGLSFASMNAIGVKFMDDLKIEVLIPETVPGLIDSITSVVANPGGELKYSLTWYNPSLNAEGKTLANLTHVVVQRATVNTFLPAHASYVVDTIATTVVGGKVTMDFAVPIAGRYYFRFNAKNADGFSPFSVTSSIAAYVGKDTVPAAVTNLIAQANNDGSVKVDFKHTGKGVNAGYLDGTITKYMVIRSPYFSSSAVIPLADTTYVVNTSFTTPVLPLGYYIFRISAVRNNLNMSAFATAYSVGGVSQNKKLVQNGEVITTNSSVIYPLGFNNISATNSTFSQLVYTPAEIGGACLIDSLYLFAQNLEGVHFQRIYIGYKADTVFASNSDFSDVTTMRLVYEDTVKSVTNSNVIAIKVSPFSYDGKQPLMITFVKPLQPKPAITTGNPSLFQMLVPSKMLSRSASIDFSVTPPTSGATLGSTRAITVVNKVAGSANVGGVIKNPRGSLIDKAKITIKVGEEIFTTTTTSADGKYFVYLPANTYTIQVSSIMMADYTGEVALTAGEAKTFNITLTDADKISLTGFIKNYKKELLEGVAITVVGDTTYNIVSDAQGKFVIGSIYGATTYNLTAKKSGYNNYTKAVKLEDKDFEMDTIKLNYDPIPVVGVQASQTNNIATITWSNPGGAKLLSWSKDSTGTNSIGAGGDKILVAQTFSAADLAAAGAIGTTGKITKVKFKAHDVTASFTLKIFQGTNPVETSAIYTQEIGKVAVGSHEITLTTPCVVDASKDLYIAFELAAGYTGFPMGCDEGPIVPGKGGRIHSSGSWGDLPANLSFNWIIYATLSIEVSNNPAGYHVYRGISGSESSVNTWSKLNSTMLTTSTYTDNTFAALSFGQYKYAVKADWMNDNLSPATISNIVNKDMEFKVEAQVNTNGAPKTGAKVTLSNVNGSVANIYTIDAPASGLVSFPKIWRGIYNVMVTLPGHTAIEVKNVNIAKDTNLALPSLIEIISDPNITEVTVTDNAVLMNWSILPEGSWSDNFESYEDFAIAKIGDYILSSPVGKGGMQGISWKNVDEKQSYIVMNPNKTTPSLVATDPSYAAHSGDKYVAAWFSTSPPNNDWLIRSVKATNGGKLSFYARGIGFGGVQETFRVLASTKTSASADFVKLHTATSIKATATWTQYTYDVPAGAKFIAINCTSDDLFGFFVDDISFSSGTPANPKSYEIYLDGTKVADTVNSVSKYLFRNLSPGAHIVGIKAIYYSGASTLVTEKITIANVTKPINPSVSMHEGNAVFTWDIPSGYTPTAYEIYLDGTKVTDVTAKTYTFISPSIGNHTAGVIAVFGSEKSAMTTANFKVVRIDDVAANAGINVYPNPSSTGQFNLSVESSYEVSVLQYNGKVVMSKKVTAGESVIDLSNQPQGVYFIKLTSVEGSYTVKIVK